MEPSPSLVRSALPVAPVFRQSPCRPPDLFCNFGLCGPISTLFVEKAFQGGFLQGGVWTDGGRCSRSKPLPQAISCPSCLPSFPVWQPSTSSTKVEQRLYVHISGTLNVHIQGTVLVPYAFYVNRTWIRVVVVLVRLAGPTV